MATVKELEKRLSELERKVTAEGEPNVDVSRDVVQLLTDDIQAHRDYVQKLYRNAATVGGVIVAAGVGLAFWILGEQLDAKVFEYRIVDALRTEAAKISAEIVTDAKDQAKKSVRTFVETEISKEAAKQVKVQLASLDEETLADLVKRITFPTGFVVATDNEECPDGWSTFEPARGRMIVGVGVDFGFGQFAADPRQLKVLKSLFAFDGYELLEKGGSPGIQLGTVEVPIAQADETNKATVWLVPGLSMADDLSDFVWKHAATAASASTLPPYIALNFCRKD